MTIMRTELGETRERAKLLRFEPNGSIEATNVQDAITEVAAEGLPGLVVPSVKVISGAIATNEVQVQTNQAGAIALALPASAAWAVINGKYGVPLSIFDISGAASARNVTINPNGAETISGLPNLVINTDYGGYRLEPKSTGGWVVV